MDAETIFLLEQSLAESTPVIEQKEINNDQTAKSIDSSISGSSSSACYLGVKQQLSENLLLAISQINKFNYLSSCYEIAEILLQTFGKSRKEGHWLWCAQHYNPRQIVWSLAEIYKRILKGKSISENSGDYFTYLLKHREPRAEFKKKEAVK